MIVDSQLDEKDIVFLLGLAEKVLLQESSLIRIPKWVPNGNSEIR